MPPPPMYMYYIIILLFRYEALVLLSAGTRDSDTSLLGDCHSPRKLLDNRALPVADWCLMLVTVRLST